MLVLASGSRSRAELLARLELPFVCERPDFDERAHDHRFAELGPHDFALLLARGKARAVAERRPGDWILAADQLGVLDEEILHKPGTTQRAIATLMRLRGRTHRLINAIVLVGPDGFEAHELDEARLTMREFDEAEARTYVEGHRPLESVGAYHIEDAGIRLFEQIEGDMTGIIGLPLLAVCRLLRAAQLL